MIGKYADWSNAAKHGKPRKAIFPGPRSAQAKKPDLVFAGFNAMRIVFQFYIQIWDDCVIEHEVARTASKKLTLELHDAPLD